MFTVSPKVVSLTNQYPVLQCTAGTVAAFGACVQAIAHNVKTSSATMPARIQPNEPKQSEGPMTYPKNFGESPVREDNPTQLLQQPVRMCLNQPKVGLGEAATLARAFREKQRSGW